MNDVDEILDFDDNGDFNFSEDPQVADSNLMEGDGMFDLDAEMSFATGEQRAEVEKFSTEEENKEISEPTNNQLSENTELDDNSTLAQQKDQEELKYDDFDMDDPDFLKEYGDVSGDVTIEDDEFWKELGLDPPNEVVKEENESITEKSGTTDKIDTDNTNISKSIPKENAPKKQPSQSDAAKVNSTKLDVSSNKTVKRTSKSPEEEDGEIINTSTSSDRQQQPQKQKSSQSQQQTQTQRQAQTQRTQVQRQQQQNNHQQPSSQNYRGRGNRRNDWRPVNNNGSFLGNNMSSFRSGFGPGLEGMPGIPMGQMPHMLPGLNMPPGMIGPNIHVNPNFARLRPHALPFQYPMGSGGPPMNMMPYQGQMDMHPYHPSMTPMGSGRGNNTSYGRGGSPGFNHHSSASTRRPQINQQNNNNQPQRPSQPSPKRKVPNDGFDQKEPDSKKVSVTNGKPSTPDAKSSPASQKNAEKSKVTSSPVTTKNTSSSTVVKTSNSKQGTSTANTNKTASAATKNKVTPTSDSRSGSTPTKQTPKPAQKPVPKNTARNVPTKAVDVKTVDASTDASKSTATSSAAPASGNKLTIGNVVERVTKRDIQDLANKVPGGSLSITFDRSAQTAEVVFKTSEGAKIFRRKYNRSVLCGSNIIVNFS